MTMRRIASAVLAGSALVAAPLITGGVASANTSGGHHESKGSLVYAPVNAPVQTNTCGNTINTVGELNPAFGNTCVADGGVKNKDRVSTGSTTHSSSAPEVPTLPLS